MKIISKLCFTLLLSIPFLHAMEEDEVGERKLTIYNATGYTVTAQNKSENIKCILTAGKNSKISVPETGNIHVDFQYRCENSRALPSPRVHILDVQIAAVVLISLKTQATIDFPDEGKIITLDK